MHIVVYIILFIYPHSCCAHQPHCRWRISMVLGIITMNCQYWSQPGMVFPFLTIHIPIHSVYIYIYIIYYIYISPYIPISIVDISIVYMEVSWNGGTPSHHPASLGYPHWWKPPMISRERWTHRSGIRSLLWHQLARAMGSGCGGGSVRENQAEIQPVFMAMVISWYFSGIFPRFQMNFDDSRWLQLVFGDFGGFFSRFEQSIVQFMGDLMWSSRFSAVVWRLDLAKIGAAGLCFFLATSKTWPKRGLSRMAEITIILKRLDDGMSLWKLFLHV